MNFFKYSLLAFCFLISGFNYAETPDTMPSEQSMIDAQSDMSLCVRSCDDEQLSMLEICRIVLTECAEVYLTLYDGEKDDLVRMATELMTLQTMVEQYCDSCLKDDPIMKKYKEFMRLENMSLHGTVGCQSCDEANYEAVRMPFSIKTFLENQDMQAFYDTLDTEEKKQYKHIVKGMNNFCQDVVKTIEMIVDHYPSLKEKIKAELEAQGLRLMITVQFDEPLPSATYQVI